ncbi:HAD family hydrolase [Candidatus Skiveiella danica]|uniref:HAD family hydrolase n=1 Tax=Candidatus Skiveiella danica TaxID=3386177 RepID=UPI0039B883F4
MIFDMDGTMVDSMPRHAQAWVEFARRRDLAVDAPDLMGRTTGRNGSECTRELMGRNVGAEEATQMTREKEDIYQELFAAGSGRWGFRQFARRRSRARAEGGGGHRGRPPHRGLRPVAAADGPGTAGHCGWR